MVENEQDNDNKVLDEFELSSELSALVENGVILKKIAKRLELRLKEKKVKITSKQLNQLAEKIRDIMHEFIKELPENQRQAVMGELKSQGPDENTKKMLETIQQLKGKIGELEIKKTEIIQAQKPKEEAQKTPSPEVTPPKTTEQALQEKKELAPPEGKTTKEINQPKSPEQTRIEKQYYKPPRLVTTEDIKIPGQNQQVIKEWHYLDPLIEIPGDTESIIILMKWLQSLIDKCGHQYLSNILDYYVDIGWITDDVKISLIDYSQGISGYNRTGKITKDVSDLPSKDHIESLMFIQKLKGIQFDKHFIDRIESELSRITKKVNSYNSK